MGLRVAVVQGGPSSEAEVSRASAAGVARALEEAGHQPVRLELDVYLADSIRTGGYDLAFPVAHGAVGEDGSLQGLLEVLEVPYVGSGVLASALAMDKGRARKIFAGEALPIARGRSVPRQEPHAAARACREEIGARLVVKPACNGSAIGVTLLGEDRPLEDVARALEEVWALDDVAIVEHFARGREITCGVLDEGEGPHALPPTEIASPKDAFYTYEARYAPGRSVHTCPAPLGDALTRRVQDVAVAAHQALGCRDLSRVDFVVGDVGDPNAVFLLEVNTMPGMTGTSLYPEAAAAAKIPFPDLCDRLVRAAHRRGVARRNRARPLPK